MTFLFFDGPVPDGIIETLRTVRNEPDVQYGRLKIEPHVSFIDTRPVPHCIMVGTDA